MNQKSDYYDQVNLWSKDLEPYQLQVQSDILSLLPNDIDSILDLGCGSGVITNVLPEDILVVGTDFSFEAVKKLTRNRCVSSIENIPFKDQSFDLVMINDVIEHLPEALYQRAVENIGQLAKKYILVTVPYKEDLSQGMTLCEYCGGSYHVNWHQRSLDIPDLKGLFSERLRLSKVCFSGDLWSYTRSPFTKYKRELGHFTYLKDAVCPRCHQSASVAGVDEDNPLLKTLTKLENDYLRQASPPLRHQADRTECIVLYEKGTGNNKEEHLHIVERGEKSLPKISQWHLNDIFFDNAGFMQKKFLLSQYPWSYYVVADGTPSQVTGKGILFRSEDASNIRIICSFPEFCQKRQYFSLSGELIGAGSATLNFSIYDAQFSQYRPLGTLELTETGLFSTDLKIDPVLTSIYGTVVEIVCCSEEDSTLRLEKASLKVKDDKGPEWPFIKVNKGYSCLQYILKGVEYRYGFHLSSDMSIPFPRWFEIVGLETSEGRSTADKLDFENDLFPMYFLHSLREENKALTDNILKLTQENQELQRRKQEVQNLLEKAEDEMTLLRTSLGIKQVLTVMKKKDKPIHIVMLAPDDIIDRRIIQEARSLVKTGKKVTIISSPLPPNYQNDEDSNDGIEIIRINADKAAELPNILKGAEEGTLSVPYWVRLASYFRRHFPRFFFSIRNRLNRYVPFLKYPWTLLEKLRTSNLKQGTFLEQDWTLFYFYDLHFFYEAVQHKADIYTAHDLPVLPAVLRAAHFHGAKVVYDAHELYPEQNYFSPEKRELCASVETELAPMADLVITVNQSIASEMSKRYEIPPPKVILNCTSRPENFSTSSHHDLLRAVTGISKNKQILLFQGGLSVGRNLENLVKAMSLIKSHNVVLVLMGPAGIRPELEKIWQSKGILEKNVFFLDPVPQKELLFYTASADAGMIPYPHIDLNSYYCTPNKLFEFLLSGLPILGNDSPELNRFVSKNGVGINRSMETPELIAHAIDEMFSDLDRLKAFRDKAIEIGPQYEWENEGKKIVHLYSKLLLET